MSREAAPLTIRRFAAHEWLGRAAEWLRRPAGIVPDTNLADSAHLTLPDHGVLARFEARDHLGAPDATLRDNVESFLADNGVSLGDGACPGTILMAAHPRSLGHCFNPISVFWCFGPDGEQRAVVVEVRNTYGDRHAYLVHPDEQGRARTDKQMYVSPFHGTDGTYELTVPAPTEAHGSRLHVVVELESDGAGNSTPSSGNRMTVNSSGVSAISLPSSPRTSPATNVASGSTPRPGWPCAAMRAP